MSDFPLANYSKAIFVCVLALLPVMSVNAASLPPDPDNAALLYYQAYERLPEPDNIESELLWPPKLENLYEVLRGGEFEPFADTEKRIREIEEEIKKLNIDPNENITKESFFDDSNDAAFPVGEIFTFDDDIFKLFTYQELTEQLEKLKERNRQITDSNPNEIIRRYLRDCGESIELAYAAAEISKCDWGIRYSQGMQANIPDLSNARRLMIAMRLDAMVQVADGNYMKAFEKSISILKMARHFKNDFLVMEYVSDSAAYIAFDTIGVNLEKSDPNEDTLLWLKGQLKDIDSKLKINKNIIWNEFQGPFQSIRSNPEIIENYTIAHSLKGQLSELLKEEISENDPNSESKEELTNEELLNLTKEPFQKYIDTAIKIMESDSPYLEKYSEIEKLRKEFQDRDYIYNGDDPIEVNQKEMLKLVMHPEKLLSYIISMVSIDASTVFGSYTYNLRCISYANATQAAIDIYLIHARTGQLPEELPEGLAKDPYTGQDFEYILTDDGFKLRCREKDINNKMTYEFEYKL